MLLYKLLHGLIKQLHIPRILARTLPFEMYDRRIGQIIILISRLHNAVAQVYVLGIHEKTLIKSFQYIQYFAPRKKECTRKHIGLTGFIRITATLVITCKNF